jgi:hypothetical protein
MKGSCKLCGAVIETDPDPLMDADHEKRERTAFFNRIAFHIDPRNHACTKRERSPGEGGYERSSDHKEQRAQHNKYVITRFNHTMQENGWFQRWRLLACLDSLDEYSLSKQEEWREYLHTITSKRVVDAIADIESKHFDEPPKVN